VNTHWHGDHTGGNENFAGDGALIIAHENVRERVSTEQFNKAWNRKTPPQPEIAWPVITFDEGLNMHVNGEDIHVFHVHKAHTDGDSFIFFTEGNVLHMGDCFFNKRFPYIDLSSGGTVDGAIDAIKAALMVVNDETAIIPGHGDLASKEDLKGYLEMLKTMKQRVVDGLAEGRSLDELKTADLDKGYEGWGDFFISTEALIDIIWTDLERG
jgi:glyoxylase-like metal-dependent hydrolase (beta-lactamase superfamily II)